MKQDERDKPKNAKSALADYYDDLLGSIAGDPLLSDAISDDAEKALSLAEASPPVKEAPVLASETESAERGSVRSAAPETQRGSTRKTATKQAQFQEESRTPALMTSPVIPAAFPKLAPSELKVEPAPPQPAPPQVETQQASIKVPTAPEEKLLSPELSPPDLTAAEDSSSELAAPVLHDEGERVSAPPEWHENGRPHWGQERFECLLFSVAGLKLAVPLISLGSIHKIEKEFTPLVGRADWFMGLYRTQERNVHVVDTALWVMPDRYSDEVREGYQFIIRLGDTNWGMACNSVEQAIQLAPSQVKWRTQRGKRPWLSGTVIDHMCALLDADTLSYLLQENAQLPAR